MVLLGLSEQKLGRPAGTVRFVITVAICIPHQKVIGYHSYLPYFSRYAVQAVWNQFHLPSIQTDVIEDSEKILGDSEIFTSQKLGLDYSLNVLLVPIGVNEVFIQTVFVHDAVPVFIGVPEIVQNAVRINLSSNGSEDAGLDHGRREGIKATHRQSKKNQDQ
jgi:hypothetical protein